ncbi:MAG: HEAT repeat domain-containing protein, partial [Pirellulaceae bacterium]|nr:HEAT repeat domain-containing protein [Pirellulaceae bacterium]
MQLFPALLDGLRHVSIAAPILDLANFLYREQLVATHPAAGREKEFAQLLTGITQRLSRLEERPEEVDRELGAVVRDSSALAVALCHTLSLLGAKE